MGVHRTVRLLGAVVVWAGVLSACGDSGDNEQAKHPIVVTASEQRCALEKTTLRAGTYRFAVTNKGAEDTGFSVYAEGDRIVGQVEGIKPGSSRTLVVELAAGTYQGACGKGIRTDLTVTGSAPAQVSTDAKLTAAVRSYQKVVAAQSSALVEKTQEFVAAVKAKDIGKARALYPVARSHWEFIEPVAESFGELDPAIDAREADLEAGRRFTGFHRLEKDLWGTRDVSGSGPIADELLVDVRKIVDLAGRTTLTAVQLANGSKELLDEIARRKVTGEEDIFSHTDLWDFASNVAGSKAAIAALRPVLLERDPALVKLLDARFALVDAALAKHVRGAGFRFYNELTPAEIKELATAINAVGEPVSRVAAVVAVTK
jgi:iron uptake system component EfeO